MNAHEHETHDTTTMEGLGSFFRIPKKLPKPVKVILAILVIVLLFNLIFQAINLVKTFNTASEVREEIPVSPADEVEAFQEFFPEYEGSADVSSADEMFDDMRDQAHEDWIARQEQRQADFMEAIAQAEAEATASAQEE